MSLIEKRLRAAVDSEGKQVPCESCGSIGTVGRPVRVSYGVALHRNCSVLPSSGELSELSFRASRALRAADALLKDGSEGVCG